jgi:acetate kinase
LSSRYAEKSGKESARVITLQLGQGCSIAAVKDGHPLDTSMGFTPLEGLMMGTRCGDVDAGALVHIAAKTPLTPEEMLHALSERSGLLGLSGASSDIRKLLRLEAQGHAGAALALQAFCHRVRKYIGAYFAVLDGAEAIVFGGGIGEHSPAIRARICAGMEWFGLVVDEALNAKAIGVEAPISVPSSRIAVYVIPVDEEIVIARETRNYLEREP